MLWEEEASLELEGAGEVAEEEEHLLLQSAELLRPKAHLELQIAPPMSEHELAVWEVLLPSKVMEQLWSAPLLAAWFSLGVLACEREHC